MARKAEAERRLISQTGCLDRAFTQEGFTLLETVCVLAIVALLAAIVLPKMPVSTSRSRLEAYASETATLLAWDRNAAIRRHVRVSTSIDATARLVRSTASGRVLRVPDDISFNAILPALCNGRPAFSTIGFFPSGVSCGGTIVLARMGVAYEIRVNWLTGGVEVVSRSPP